MFVQSLEDGRCGRGRQSSENAKNFSLIFPFLIPSWNWQDFQLFPNLPLLVQWRSRRGQNLQRGSGSFPPSCNVSSAHPVPTPPRFHLDEKSCKPTGVGREIKSLSQLKSQAISAEHLLQRAPGNFIRLPQTISPLSPLSASRSQQAGGGSSASLCTARWRALFQLCSRCPAHNPWLVPAPRPSLARGRALVGCAALRSLLLVLWFLRAFGNTQSQELDCGQSLFAPRFFFCL